MKIKIIQNIKSIILALILVVGVSYVSAASVWKDPTSNPPLNNANIPLNTSSTGQSKAGGLTLNTGGAANGLIVDKGLTILRGGLQVPTGAGVGKVLTSDASGNATWGAGGSSSHTLTSCTWIYSGESLALDNAWHSVSCPTNQVMAGWQCYASNRLDGDCYILCCVF